MNRKTYTASTTCPGFEFKPLKLVTKADFYRLCMRLQEMFGKGWEFEPDTALEGGIKVTNWPGKIGEMKRTMRFWYSNPDMRDWRWSAPREFQEWENSSDIIWYPLSPRPRKDWCETILKSFYPAPQWSHAEVHIFAKVLDEFGVVTRKMPRSLHTWS